MYFISMCCLVNVVSLAYDLFMMMLTLGEGGYGDWWQMMTERGGGGGGVKISKKIDNVICERSLI